MTCDLPQYHHRACHSPSEQERAMPGWRQSYAQLESGRFLGEVCSLAAGTVTLYREEISVRAGNRFLHPEGMMSAFFVLGAQGAGQDGGKPLSPQDLSGFHLTSGEEEFIHEAGMRIAVVQLPMATLGLQRPRESLWGRWSDVPGSAITALADWLDRMLDPAAGAYSRGRADFLALAPRLVTDQLTLWLGQTGWTAVRNRADCRARARLAEALHDAPADLCTVTDLVALTGLGAADLRSLCREATGLSLDRMLMVRRLNGVQRGLRAAAEAGGAGVKISDLAMDHGFMHWGRFSAAYRAFFGELPSQTLRGGARPC